MSSLIKAELYRLKNEKSMLVMFIVAIVFAIINVCTPLLFSGSNSVNMTKVLVDCFSMGSNVGLILSIVSLVVSCKEYKYGTIRNKIIAGHSRSSIFFSKLLANVLSCTLILFAYYIVTYLICLCYGPKIIIPNFLTIMKILLFGILTIILAITFLHTIAMIMQSVGKSIGTYLVITIIVNIVFQLILINILASNPESNIGTFFEWIPSYQVLLVASDSTYNFAILLLKGIVVSFGLSGLIVFFGTLLFRKKDIK